MKKSNLINIPVGERGLINGKWYESQKTDMFGSANCFSCDFFTPGDGCNNRNVVCYCPPRTFKEVSEPAGYYDCYDYEEWENTKVWHLVILIIILCIPMGMCWIKEKVLTLGIYIINKIKQKDDTNKQGSSLEG
jgi:hypothetical protein